MDKGKVTEVIRFFEKCLKEKGVKVSKIIGSQIVLQKILSQRWNSSQAFRKVWREHNNVALPRS